MCKTNVTPFYYKGRFYARVEQRKIMWFISGREVPKEVANKLEEAFQSIQ